MTPGRMERSRKCQNGRSCRNLEACSSQPVLFIQIIFTALQKSWRRWIWVHLLLQTGSFCETPGKSERVGSSGFHEQVSRIGMFSRSRSWGLSCSATAEKQLQKTCGIILQRPATFSDPNFSIYHFLVESEVTARFDATKPKPANTVLFSIWPFGAAAMAIAKYIKHSLV